MKRTATGVLIGAMKVLANDIQSEDQLANMAIQEAADRLEELWKYQDFFDFVSFLIVERREECQGRVFYDAVKKQWQQCQGR